MPQETLINIGICASALVVWILALISSVSLRRLGCLVAQGRNLPIDNKNGQPPVSIVITAHNQEAELQRNLPIILEQYYPNFEVIVVDIASKDGTKDLLERLEEDHSNLRHTFTPDTSRDISQTRLAITLGMKSATHSCVIITQAEYAPVSHNWLLHMVNSLSHHRSALITLGYTRYNSNGFGQKKLQFFNLWQQMLALPYAAKHGAYRTGGENIIYSKELFMQHQGFASSATLLTGATDIMVNRNSTKDNTTICVHPESILCRNLPKEKRMWLQERVFYQETRTHFKRRFGYRARYVYRSFIHALNHIMLLVAMAVGVIVGYYEEPLWYIASGLALLLGLIHFIAQGINYNYTSKLIDDRKQNYFITSFYVTFAPFWDFSAWIRHKFTNQKQFRKKYI